MERSELTVDEVSARAKSRAEIDRLLPVEWWVYLTLVKDKNFQILRDIITGSKKVYWKDYFGVLVHKR